MTVPPSPEGAAPDFNGAKEALNRVANPANNYAAASDRHDDRFLIRETFDAAEALLASQSSEIAELRQDAERWRAVRLDSHLTVNEDGNAVLLVAVSDWDAPIPGLDPPAEGRVKDDGGILGEDEPMAIDAVVDALIAAEASRASGTTQEDGT